MTRVTLAIVGASVLAAGAAAAQAPRTEVVINGGRAFPESITSTRDGALITGSVGFGGVLRAAPGAANAIQWIAPGSNGLLETFGVLADEASGTLWVCSSRNGAPPPGAAPPEPALYAFDLKTAAFRARYPLPDGTGLCNDIAIGPDRAAYVADTTGGRVLRLAPRAKALEVWIKSPDLAGADGLAFLGRRLFVNSFTTGKLLALDLKADGKAAAPVALATSRPLVQPDGMRRAGPDQLVMAEGSPGRIDLLTVKGDTVEVKTLREGLTGPAAVTLVGRTAWGLESKLALRRTPDVVAAPFKAYAIPLPGAGE